MSEDLRVVFESRHRGRCSDRALVLSAVDIPYRIVEDSSSCAIVVPAAHSARAVRELQLYEDENPPQRPRPVRRIESHDPVPGLAGYTLVVCLVAGMAGFSWFGSDWLAAGRVDGALFRDGEIWRVITAQTLHADVRHLLSNLVFGIFFGFFAGRLLGSGVAWLTILLAAALGNAMNLLLLDSGFRSIGASSAVFAALGLIAGYVWRGRLMPQDRGGWTTRYGPIVGGLALLMYTGTGGENTDIGAHFFGFAAGFSSGILLIRLGRLPNEPRAQLLAGGLALALVAGSWGIALHFR